MIKLSESTWEDVQQIKEWAESDPYHFHQGRPEWWITGAPGSLLAFCLMDERGPLCYVRLDEENGRVRIHTQFAPKSVVSTRRLAVGMLECMKLLKEFYRNKKGLIFNSVSPSLIAFMKARQGFISVGSDDYQFDFEEQN